MEEDHQRGTRLEDMARARLSDLRRVVGSPFGSRRKPAGAAPGTLVAEPSWPKPRLTAIAYGPEGLEEQTLETVEQAAALKGKHPVLWLDVTGLGDIDLLQKIGEAFEIHPLALEDVVSLRQRMKVEEYPGGTFVIARMLHRTEDLISEQLALVLSEGFVVTFQQLEGDCFDPVRDRLRRGAGRIRKGGADYLLYALLDAVVDTCFPLLEAYQLELDALEDAIVDHAAPSQMARLITIRKDFTVVRRALWPAREALTNLLRGDHPRIQPDTQLYLRDTEDHVLRLLELLESVRELATGLTDLYLNFVSNRMNETMKVLTIIATIFIPLSFLAGLYGMNFDPGVSPYNMPELSWYWGYPTLLSLMLILAVVMLSWFYRKGWIGRGK